MSTEYESFLGIGKRLANEEYVKEFLKSHTPLVDSQIESILDGGSYLGVSAITLYWGDWFVGFEMHNEDGAIDSLINNVCDAHERWDAIFKDVEPRVVHDVKAW